MAKTPVAEQVQVNFRMPSELRDKLKIDAQLNGRSLNAEIVDRLERSYVVRTSKETTELAIAYLTGMLRASRDGNPEASTLIERLTGKPPDL